MTDVAEGAFPLSRAHGGKEGSRDALRALLHENHAMLFRWAMTCAAGDRELALDVLQTSYVSILEQDSQRPLAWVYGVVRRTTLALKRKERARRLGLVRFVDARGLDVEAPAVDHAANGEQVVRIRVALASLPGRQREVLELVFYHGLTIREASEVVGVRLGTARKHYERGKRAMLDKLKSEDL